MVRFLLLLSAAFLLLSCASQPEVKPDPAPPPEAFRVMTWNVNWGVGCPGMVAETIRRSGAEVVCLQETNEEWRQVLRRDLGREYPFQVFRESAGRMGGGLAFLSRRAGREIAYVPSVTGWFDGWIMAFRVGGREAQMLNVHLRPPVTESGGAIRGYLTTGDDRLAEMQRFAGYWNPDMPTIVCGDFNESPRGAAVRWLERRGFGNALSSFQPRATTWAWPAGPITLRRRMDHVMVSPGLAVRGAKVVRVDASDHFPVIVDLGWK